MGIGKVGKGALLLAVGAAGGGAALAVASVPDSGVIHACVEVAGGEPLTSTGNVRIIDPSAQQTCNTGAAGAAISEQSIAWNTTGPPGATGPTGPTGPPGTPGAPGAPGRSVTIAGGNTLTIGGGQVVTVGRSPTLTVTSPPLGNRTIATLSLTGGIKTGILGYSFAAAGGAATGSGATGKAAVHDIQITKELDKASPKLFLACATGKHFNGAIIVVAKGSTTITYKMKDVIVAAAQTTGKGAKVIDSFTLNFAKLAIEYKS